MATARLSDQPQQDWKIVPQGDRCLILVFGSGIDPATSRRCIAAAAALREAGLDEIRDIVPTYNSVAVHHHPCADTRHSPALAQKIDERLRQAFTGGLEPGAARQVDIEVCYGGEYGPDLPQVAEHCGLSEADVVRLHSATLVQVLMLGFAAGAPYLGLIDQRLDIPRRSSPRVSLPAGSVAIANRQTMIYPESSPGGWHIIGATKATLFDPSAEPPTLLAPGDSVRFVPVSQEEFRAARGLRP
ncbi:5-oxoprolinase subunit PxpB [Candidimonas humi]|jgi:KipI family sensor histidine kinase inhibitor|uniref:5-oxoprolinase subunit PxpB n=1 Tax=Candidimonas humi TaxID=683355 RepID=A0ABV8NZL8_9BURK|nr:5-oxoprolinase subunit PxpB [Candidimonas humi]MBV6305775.1 5-oxoprolinase subunit PxpB [Candidimonas humi]